MPGEDDRSKDYFGERPPPTVDPSKLTTDAVDRLEHKLTEIAKSQRQSDREYLNVQLDALRSIANQAALIAQNIRVEISSQNERFTSIKGEFALRDANLDKALTAAKELVSVQQISNDRANLKMEAGFEKRIDVTGLLISTMEKALSDKIEDVKIQASTAIPRIEVTSANVAMSERVAGLEKFSNNMQGRMWVIAAVVVIMEVALRFLGK
jgi:hypothetical protein